MKPLAVASALASAWMMALVVATPVNDRTKSQADIQRYFPRPKHFQEVPYLPHYDARFNNGEVLGESAQMEDLRVLIQTYLSTFRELGIQTWLMHGSLLGWWWGKKVLPWDLDADVMITETDMYFLAAYHNMTVYYYKYDSMETGRYFLLEVNPYFIYRGQDDALNRIDGRWVDMDTGLYIDITAARYNPDHPEGEGVLFDKHGHEFRDNYLFPLRETTFEGVPVKIPYRYEDMLTSEYGEKATRVKVFHNHIFNDAEMQWEAEESI